MTTRLAVLASALALGAAVGMHGCADDRAAIQIQAICSPPSDCTFAGRCDMQFIGFPTLDIGTSTTGRLWLFLQVENQLPNNGDLDAGRLNTNDAHIDQLRIEYEGAPFPPVVVGTNFSVPAGATGVVSVEVIPSVLGALTALAAPSQLVARVRFAGYYDDDTRFETGEFPITVRICDGCEPVECADLVPALETCPPDSEGQEPVTCRT